MDAIFVPLLLVLIVNNVYTEQCIAEEHFPKCNRLDNDCVREKLEPYTRAWMLKGQPGYFMESVNPISYPELPIPTSKGLYKLQNVQITGFPEAKFLYFKYSPDKGLLDFAYEFKFDLTADGFTDATGQSILAEGPLIVHFDNLVVKSKSEVSFVERCGESYMKFDNSLANVEESSDNDIVFKSGLQNLEPEIKQSLVQIVGKVSMKKIADNYRQIARIVPFSVFWE